jgi:hypothetical protein
MNSTKNAPLSGAAGPNEFSFFSGEGTRADVDAIFPILKGTSTDDMKIVGTGFYIMNTGVFITARHCFSGEDGEIDSGGSFFLHHTLPGNIFIRRPILHAWNSDVGDISVGTAAPMTNDNDGTPLINSIMTLTTERPPIATRIVTYAYAGSSISRSGKKIEIMFRPNFFSGKIIDYHPHARDRSMLPWPVFETDMHLHGGASGGPVVTEQDGTVFAINTSSLDGSPDISYVTPLDLVLDAELTNLAVDKKAPQNYSIRELGKKGIIIFKPPFPVRD